MEGYQWGEGGERMKEKVQGIRSINGRYKIVRGRIKNSIGNGEARELICMTHGHELRWGNAGGKAGCRVKGNKEEIKNGTTVIALSIKYIFRK